MCNLKYLVVLSISALLATGHASAQNKQQANPMNQAAPTQNDELNKLIDSPSAQVQFPTSNIISKTGKPLNTPAATGGADYDSNIVTGLDEYKNRKRMVAERVAEMQRMREEEFRRQAYEQALRSAQEREKSRMAKAGKKMTTQEYFDKQTKAMQGQN